MPEPHEDHPATIVTCEGFRISARLDDGTDVHVLGTATQHARLVPGARVFLWRLRRSSSGLDAARADLDPEDHENYAACLKRFIEDERIAAAKREKKAYSPPLVPGQFRAVVVPSEPGEKKTRLELEDGRVALCWSSGRFEAVPGVRVLVRRTEERRGELWAPEIELDQAHREAYERLVSFRHVDRVLSELAADTKRRGVVAEELPRELPGRVSEIGRLGGALEIEHGGLRHRVEFASTACDAFTAEVGIQVIARRFRRRADGSLAAEDLVVDEATRLSLKRRKRAATDMERGAVEALGDSRLEAAVLDDGSEAAWDALERWLRERADPRAELVRLERAIERTPTPALQAERDAHFAKHRPALLGELAEHEADVSLEFRRGFVRTLAILEGRTGVGERLRAALKAPVMRLVEEVVLDGSERDIGRVLTTATVRSIRSLAVGYAAIVPLEASLGRAAPVLERLIDLELRGTQIELPPLSLLARLERLALRSADLGRARVVALAGTPLPKLRALELGLGRASRREDAVRLEDVERLIDPAHSPGLTALGVENTTLTNALARLLPTHPAVERLESLGLADGTLTDGGAAALGCAPGAFRKLRKLDVSENLLTPLGVDYVRRAFPSADVSRQREGYGSGERNPAVLSGPRVAARAGAS